MSDREQESLREAWQREACPDLVHRLRYLRGAAEHLERGGRLLLRYSQSLFIERTAAAGEQSAKIAADAVAATTTYDAVRLAGRTLDRS
jgi:hypothetical protein